MLEPRHLSPSKPSSDCFEEPWAQQPPTLPEGEARGHGLPGAQSVEPGSHKRLQLIVFFLKRLVGLTKRGEGIVEKDPKPAGLKGHPISGLNCGKYENGFQHLNVTTSQHQSYQQESSCKIPRLQPWPRLFL